MTLHKWTIMSLLFLNAFFPIKAHAKKRITPSDGDVMSQYGQYKEDRNALNPNEINIFVWNMYKARQEGWEQDFKELVPNYDILLLQELWIEENGLMKRVFEEDPKFTYQMCTAFYDTKEEALSGVGIGSEVKPIDVSWQRSKYKEPMIGTHKMVIFAEYALDGRSETLLTGSIHAINFVSAKKLRDQLQKVAQKVKAHQGPVVFAGDFNTWSDQKLEYLAEFAKDAGLTEVIFPNGDDRMTGKGKFLDYIFVKGVDIHSSYVFGERTGSDHKALEVKLSVK